MLLKIARLKKSTFFYAKKHLHYKEEKDKEIGDIIEKIFKFHHKRYGRPRIIQELKKMGITISNNKAFRIMQDRELSAVPKKRKYNSYKGKIGKICRNHLLVKKLNEDKHIYVYERHFETTGPYQILGTDVTQFQIAAGKLYLSPIIDFHTREILAYDISTSPNYAQIRRMMNMLFDKHGESFKGTILHSDQGYQYQMKAYQKLLKEHGIIQSMSRKGNCLDNSPTENFFGRLKTELFYGNEFEFENLGQLKKAIIAYINYYNNQRIIAKYGETPINIRQSYQNSV